MNASVNADEASYDCAGGTDGGDARDYENASGEPAQGYTSEHYYYYCNPTSASYTEYGTGYAVGSEAASVGYYAPDSAPTRAEETAEGGEGDAEVVEAEAVVVEEGQIAPNVAEVWPAEQLKSTWSCGQCTFANPISEAFCEICMGHVSLSPDCASISTDSGATANEAASLTTDVSAIAACDDPVPVATPPCAVNGEGVNSPTEGAFPPSTALPEFLLPLPVPAIARQPGASWMMTMPPHAAGGVGFSPPILPAYAPSAPEFDQDDESVSLDVQAALQDARAAGSPAPGESHPPTGRCETTDGGADSAKVDHVDFLALAFQRKTPIDSVATESTTEKTHRTRREESADYI